CRALHALERVGSTLQNYLVKVGVELFIKQHPQLGHFARMNRGSKFVFATMDTRIGAGCTIAGMGSESSWRGSNLWGQILTSIVELV
ncbi:hypothetical protein PRIPAC_83186, partial [Pristionchus pacificus]|uniref:Uncharacterized protein n=1 Tax=Pristionchus pacificus TaxID=54126 RepID=A0A2A6BNQ8_PRIPA